MRRDLAIARLKADAERIRRFGVTALYLFGSTARDEAGPKSDIDLFVDYDSSRLDLVALLRLRDHLSETLGRPADVTTRDGLHPVLREDIERQAVRVF